MKLEDINELTTANNQELAQALLNAGWRLLAVCVIQDGANQYAEYRLGRVLPEDEPQAQWGVLT